VKQEQKRENDKKQRRKKNINVRRKNTNKKHKTQLKKEERNSGREVGRTRKDNQVSSKESIKGLVRCGIAMEKRRRVRRKFLQHKTEQIKRNNKRSKKLCRGKRKTRARKEDERN
jgi:hypothetical protein